MNLIVAKGAAALSALGLAFAAGAYLNRPKPCAATKDVVRQSSDEGKKLEVKADIKDLVEVKPKVITIVKRVPVVLPGPGCPVAFTEETRTESTADSRVIQEASRQAAETQWRSVRYERVTETESVIPGWTVGLLGGAAAESILRPNRDWYLGGQITRKLFWGFAAGLEARYQRSLGWSMGAVVTKGFGK